MIPGVISSLFRSLKLPLGAAVLVAGLWMLAPSRSRQASEPGVVEINYPGPFGPIADALYWSVVLPLLRPSLATIGIFAFMGAWNDFMGPLIYVNDQKLYPLSLGLYALPAQNTGASSMGLMMACSLLMTLPVAVIFLLAQRYFIQGVTLTGMKG